MFQLSQHGESIVSWKNNLSHLEFRRHIALCLLKAEQENKRMSGSLAGLPAEAQFD